MTSWLSGRAEGWLSVVDAFHTVRLGSTVVDEVRRRVQQQTLGP